MGKLYLFRGKAATGKTMMTNLLSSELRIPVIRKDDVYDSLANQGLGHAINNRLSYEIMAKMINTSILNHCSLIIDASIAHTPYLMEFMSKLMLDNTSIQHFLCICSDEEKWKKRIESRIENPSPNQLFTSAKEALEHYQKYEIKPINDEVILDSAKDIDELMHIVKSNI